MSPEGVTAPLERAAQLPEIVDFAVENDRDVFRFVENGLAPAGKVNDAEAAHAERRRGSNQNAVLIRAAMPHRAHHPARNFLGRFRALDSYHATNSTHSRVLYRERGRSSTLTYLSAHRRNLDIMKTR